MLDFLRVCSKMIQKRRRGDLAEHRATSQREEACERFASLLNHTSRHIFGGDCEKIDDHMMMHCNTGAPGAEFMVNGDAQGRDELNYKRRRFFFGFFFLVEQKETTVPC